jgi:hypothetical protein
MSQASVMISWSNRILSICAIALFATCEARAEPDAGHFDLMCTGNMSGTIAGPETKHLSIDLQRRVWCWRGQSCEVMDIRSISPVNLVLRNEKNDLIAIQLEISRVDGSYFEILNGHLGDSTISKGVCNKAPYTTIPEAAF